MKSLNERKQKIVGFLGAGKWGRALAKKLKDICEVRLYEMNLKKVCETKEGLHYFSDIREIKDSDLIVIAVPSFAIREVLFLFRDFYSGQPILGLAKGIEKETKLLPSEIVKEVLGENVKYSHLSGPSFALEVEKDFPTKVSLALPDNSWKRDFEIFFNLRNFKVEQTDDLIGVQLGGAVKNVIAILAGLSDALNYGDNFRAILIWEGFKEMILLGKKLGAKEKTFFGPSGLGDLILTATSLQSRNYRFGLNFCKKKEGTIEGIPTSWALFHLAKKFSLNLPVIEGVYSVIFEKKSPQKVLENVNQSI